MKYILTNQPQKINETKGEIENLSVRHTIVLAAGTSIPSVGTSTITVRPGESYPFKTILGEALYAWIINANDDETLEVSVINFPSEGEGGDTDISAIETEIINQGKQLQNLSALNSRLVSAMDFRGDTPRFYGVLPAMSNQLGNGDGTTFSGGDGVDGVLIKKDGDTEGFIQIGEGYENLTPLDWRNNVSSLVTGVVVVAEGEKVKVTIPTGTLMNSWFPLKISENLLLDEGKTNNIKSTLKIDVKSGNVSEIDFLKATFKFKNDADASALGNFENLSLGSKEYKIQADNINITNSLIYNGLSINCNNVGWTTTENIVFYISKVFSVQCDAEIPFVKSQAPSGRVVYNEPWTSETNSFILLGANSEKETGSYNIYVTTKNGSASSGEYATTAKIYDNYNFLISNSYKALEGDETGNFEEITVSNTGVTINSVFNLIYDLSNETVRSTKSLKGFFCYKGNLTEEELRTELAKIKSENFLLPDSGVVENIPWAKKRADAGGNIKVDITVTDNSRDLGLVEAGHVYEIIGNDFTVYRARVEENLSITGIGIEDVSGQIRLVAGVQLPAKIRRVI